MKLDAIGYREKEKEKERKGRLRVSNDAGSYIRMAKERRGGMGVAKV